MNLKKNNLPIVLAMLLTVLLLHSCNKFQGDVTVPAYLHIDRVDVVPQTHNAPSSEAGFYSSDIDAVYIVGYREGRKSEDTIGTFQLPCTVPVLMAGDMKYIRVSPVIKISGISGMRGYYSALQTVQFNHVHLSPDSVTNLGTYDPDRQQWYVQCNYKTRDVLDVLMEDYFEPTSFSTNFDSNLVWVKNDPDHACLGQGYGRIHVPDSVQVVTVGIAPEFRPSPSKALYLEFDYKSDVEFWVHMLGFSFQTSGSAISKSVLAIYPKDHWQKMYVMLGRTWSYFNYTVPITLYIQALNPDGKGGDVLIDNVKIVSFPTI